MYECKVRYEKTQEDGNVSKVTEIYLTEGVSIGDAEKRLTEEMTPFITGEFEIIAIKKVVFSELVTNDNSDYWYKVKVYFITIDEGSGKEKKSAHQFLVQSDSADNAITSVNDFMKGTISDWEIGAVNDTNIIDVFVQKCQQD